MDFYKITNESESNTYMTYVTGLNVDSKFFYEGYETEYGGMYFAREDILAYLGGGTYLRKVTVPENANLKELNGTVPLRFKADRIILEERELITTDVIIRLIEEGANVNVLNGYILKYASDVEDTRLIKYVVKYLINNGLNSTLKKHHMLLLNAIKRNDHKMVKFLIKNGFDFTINFDSYLKLAFSNRCIKIVKLLINNLDNGKIPDVTDIMTDAAKNDEHELVKLLVGFKNRVKFDITPSIYYYTLRNRVTINGVNCCVCGFC